MASIRSTHFFKNKKKLFQTHLVWYRSQGPYTLKIEKSQTITKIANKP